MRRFEWDPGTVKVDWALDSSIPWNNAPAKAPGTVHLAESVGELADSMNHVFSRSIPDRPFLLVGQMAEADPTRAPQGGESVWAYTHVPHHTERDAGGEGIRGVWDHDDTEMMADRMQRRIEEYAPGFGDRVVARRVLGPREMQERDENLHGGALNGGTSSLHQQLVFRPVPGLGRAETPVKNLYLGSASAHPGGGVHGACGSNAARAALAHARLRRLVPGGRGDQPRPDQPDQPDRPTRRGEAMQDPGVVVVTGGSSGVGRAAARAFADRGHPVVVLARGKDSLDATAQELQARGVQALAISVDVTDRAEVDAAADRVERELGPIEVWVNSAMVTVLGAFQDVEADDFDRVHDVVFRGTANGTRTALRCMSPRNRGRIIQVGSALAYRGIPLQAAYCSAKHAVQGLSDSLRSELLHDGSEITLSEVNLPAVNTPQFDMCKNLLDGAPQPVPPIYQPEIPAAAIVEAAETGDRAVNVTFTTTRTILGNKVAPGALDRVLAGTGYSGQVTDRPRGSGDNLFEPLPGDHGCHGSFDDQARASSTQEWLRHTPLGATARLGGRIGRRVGAIAIKRVV